MPPASPVVPMSLSPERTRAYLAGALCGAFGALAVVARRDGRSGATLAAALAAAASGAAAVTFEERAEARDAERPSS